MGAYIARRILIAVFTVWAISLLAFVIIQAPEGDAATHYVRQKEFELQRTLTAEEVREIRDLWRLDKPLLVTYWNWIFNIVVHADFGRSFLGGGITAGPGHTPIRDIIAKRLPATIALTSFTIVITWTLAIPVGIYSAVRHNSIGDYTFTLLGFTGLAVPDFLLGLLIMYVLFAWFDQSVGGLFSGRYEDAAWSLAKVWDLIKHLFVPAIVLGTSGTAGLIRVMRNNLLDELGKPYVVTARAKGQVGWKVVAKYPLRVAINPFVSGIGYMLPALVGGSVIVSVVLSLPTLGPMLLVALQGEDWPLSGSIILLLGSLTVVGTLVSDLLLVVVDPRIRLTGVGR